MNPRLVATAGPLKGTIFELADQEVTIGRDPSNRFCIGSRSVSRRHCLIKREAGQFLVHDLDSHNGTFVNELPVKERSLQDGDQIQIGSTLLLFLLEEEEPPSSTPIQLDEDKLVTLSTVRLGKEEALYLQPDKVLERLPPTARIARDLNALLKVSTAINSVRDLDALQRRLLQLVFEVIPAEQGALLLVGESSEEIASMLGCNRHLGLDSRVRPSRTIVQRGCSQKFTPPP
jgi:pSer/pThr/pTyr-binding forkhead associated (FHA) protein